MFTTPASQTPRGGGEPIISLSQASSKLTSHKQHLASQDGGTHTAGSGPGLRPQHACLRSVYPLDVCASRRCVYPLGVCTPSVSILMVSGPAGAPHRNYQEGAGVVLGPLRSLWSPEALEKFTLSSEAFCPLALREQGSLPFCGPLNSLHP